MRVAEGQEAGTAGRASLLVTAWVVGAGLLGSGWAIGQSEHSLAEAAAGVDALVQAQDQGAAIEWNGRTAHLDPAGLDSHEVDEVLAALEDMGGVRSVHLLADPLLPGGEDVVAPDTSATSAAATSTTSTTVPPATTTTTAPATTVAPATTATPTTLPPTTTTPSTTNAAEGTLALERLLDGRTVEFEFSTAIPTPETEMLLDELADLLGAFPLLTLHITGHTDPVGNEVANQTLSEARAQSVANHLIIRGIDGSRMTVAGKGSTEPVADNDTLAGKQQNRRVVIEAS